MIRQMNLLLLNEKNPFVEVMGFHFHLIRKIPSVVFIKDLIFSVALIYSFNVVLGLRVISIYATVPTFEIPHTIRIGM